MGLKFGILAEGGVEITKGVKEVSRVEVHEQLGETITYTVVLGEDVCDGDFELLKHPSLMPCKEISVWVEVDDKKVYLVKGPVKSQQIKLVTGGEGSEVQIKGSDNSIKMKHVERKVNHGDETDDAIILEILGNYGFANVVYTDEGLLNDTSKHSRVQNQDDLTFIKQLANENGLFFWVSYDDDGNEIVHLDKLPLDASPSATLIINGDEESPNNIDELTISWDVDAPTVVVGQHLDAKKKEKLDAAVESPPQTKLGKVSLQQLTADCKQEARNNPRPVDDPGRAQQRSQGALNEAEWFIKAGCSTSFDRLCKVIHAHTIVEIQGAGSRHSGKYVVAGVTHTIDHSSYKMQLELMRNGWD